MNTKLIWAVAVLVVLGGAYYFLMGPGAGSMMQEDSMQKERGGTMMADGKMTGTWKSNEDGKFTRTFKADGTFIDTYEGQPSASEEGTYEVVDATKVDVGVPAAALTGQTVIKLSSKSGDLFFTVNEVNDTRLVMTYLGRGNILTFTKVK